MPEPPQNQDLPENDELLAAEEAQESAPVEDEAPFIDFNADEEAVNQTDYTGAADTDYEGGTAEAGADLFGSDDDPFAPAA